MRELQRFTSDRLVRLTLLVLCGLIVIYFIARSSSGASSLSKEVEIDQPPTVFKVKSSNFTQHCPPSKPVDPCGVCGGDGSLCAGCDGIPLSKKLIDPCGVCGGDGSQCRGCDGVPNSKKVLDACGICAGNGKSCAGCDGVPGSGKLVDSCGVCDGDGKLCVGCDAVPKSGKVLDMCGVCGGSNACLVHEGSLVAGYSSKLLNEFLPPQVVTLASSASIARGDQLFADEDWAALVSALPSYRDVHLPPTDSLLSVGSISSCAVVGTSAILGLAHDYSAEIDAHDAVIRIGTSAPPKSGIRTTFRVISVASANFDAKNIPTDSTLLLQVQSVEELAVAERAGLFRPRPPHSSALFSADFYNGVTSVLQHFGMSALASPTALAAVAAFRSCNRTDVYGVWPFPVSLTLDPLPQSEFSLSSSPVSVADRLAEWRALTYLRDYSVGQPARFVLHPSPEWLEPPAFSRNTPFSPASASPPITVAVAAPSTVSSPAPTGVAAASTVTSAAQPLVDSAAVESVIDVEPEPEPEPAETIPLEDDVSTTSTSEPQQDEAQEFEVSQPTQ
eukprot:gnl/Spiro4/25118_TR12503_c0_g1_i1.p1 gnl/Spiro4/25118_TR12503_c0_g1~~gnl/Spiro4/25118_TR12503_c0_g1_i1.p1  ORF type:complete len:560 (+),score=40.55 gnl/Spiro4/25118_TR12503_c0_g1_i1:35-1714(+)